MKTLKTVFAAASLAILFTAVTPLHAQPAAMTDAEVRKVDKEQGKVTLKHGPIANLDMPGMTMVFNVKDKAMLENVKAGDKVRFTAVNDNGKITVSEIQPAK